MKRILSFIVLLPLPLFAADFRSFVFEIVDVINLIIELLGGVALFYFFWGIATYIKAAGDEKALEKGKNIMIWGVIALFVLTSVGGLIRLMQDQFGIQGGGILQIISPSGQGGSGSSSGGGSSNSGSGSPFGGFGEGDSNTDWQNCGADSFYEESC